MGHLIRKQGRVAVGRLEKLNATWSRLNSMAEIQLFYTGGTLLSLQLLLVNFVILLIFQGESRKLVVF